MRYGKWLLVAFPIALVMIGGAIHYARPHGAESEPRQLPFTMTEVSHQIGVINHHETFEASPTHKNIEPFINSDSAAVAVADYDNDGYEDIFMNNAKVGSKCHLFHNNHDGTFTDVAEQAGLADLGKTNPTLAGYFFDYDNDGFKDLLVIGWIPRIFHNNGDGTFNEATFQLGLNPIPKLGFVIPAIVDIDGDGFLDLVFANRWGDDEIHPTHLVNFMPNSLLNATNGGPVEVFRNVGGKKFEPVRGSLGINHKGFARAVGTYDFRGSGRPDIWFANDFSVDRLYLNEGHGKFRDASENVVTHNFSRNGMNADVADIDNDGHPTIFISHIFERGERPAGNALWKWSGGDKFDEISRDRHVNRCGWAWAGKFIDLDNDGHMDLVVGNGFVSNNPNKSYWYFMNVIGASDRNVAQDVHNWPAIGDASLAGYQRACIFYNEGHGVFHNVTGLTAMANDLSDERGIAAIDYLNNGSQSLVIANQKQDAKFYRIDQKNENGWIGFKLIGTKSNRDAFGTEMQITLQDGTKLSRQLQTMNAYAGQSDERLHFGLGQGKIKSIHVLWPSGQVQEFDGQKFAINKYHQITEPK